MRVFPLSRLLAVVGTVALTATVFPSVAFADDAPQSDGAQSSQSAQSTQSAPASPPADQSASAGVDDQADDAPTSADAAASADGAASGEVAINLLGITDLHGYIEPSNDYPGAVKLACEVDAYRGSHPNTLVLSAGDNIGGSPFASALLGDEPTLDVLNAIGLDASAVGNHEFDKSIADLTDRVLPKANFPFLGGNVDGSAALDAEGSGKGYWVKDVGGVKVGVIGVVTEDTPTLVSPSSIAGLTFQKSQTWANTKAAELKDGQAANGEADVVVALVHEDAAALANGFTKDIDAVFGGHTHVPYAQKHTVGGEEIAVVQADNYGLLLGRISLKYNPNTRVTTVATADNQDLKQSACATHPQVEKIVADAQAQTKVKGAEQVATIGSDFFRGSNDGAPTGANRGTESTASNMVADSFHHWATKSLPDAGMRTIGVMNPGGVRGDFLFAKSEGEAEDGILTYSEAFQIQPFGNELSYTTLTGKQLRKALGQQFQPGTRRPVLMLGVSSNVMVILDQEVADQLHALHDSGAPDAAKVAELQEKLVWQVTVDGQGVSETDTIRVASNSFLLDGGDGFTAFTEGTGFTNTGAIDVTATIDYLKSFGDQPLSAHLDKRQVGVHFSDEGNDLKDITATFTGVLMSVSSEQVATTMVISSEGKELSRGAVDAAPVENKPETGKATATFTIPEDAPFVTCDDGTEQCKKVTIEFRDANGDLVYGYEWLWQLVAPGDNDDQNGNSGSGQSGNNGSGSGGTTPGGTPGTTPGPNQPGGNPGLTPLKPADPSATGPKKNTGQTDKKPAGDPPSTGATAKDGTYSKNATQGQGKATALARTGIDTVPLAIGFLLFLIGAAAFTLRRTRS